MTVASSSTNLLVGLGITGRAVATALLARGHRVVAIDDRPDDAVRSFVAAHGIELHEAPSMPVIEALVAGADRVLPTPGLPDHHPVIRHARRVDARIQSEFDLAAEWDPRPIAAVTGTDGKTTVTTMVADMLERSGVRAALAGNNDVPLVEAIDDAAVEVFVVEASSFRLGHSEHFAPTVATWLNFAPDHLEVHDSLESYESAKAAVFAHQTPTDTAIVNADDPVVMRNLGRARRVTFSPEHGDFRVVHGVLTTDSGDAIVPVEELGRKLPHDVSNALAAAATALAVGADIGRVADSLRAFTGLPHRIQFIAEHRGVRYVNDSKATVPHAVVTAVQCFPSVVLIAGGRNKGLDLGPLGEVARRLRAVVAIGESAPEVRAVFEPLGVRVADVASMHEAVAASAAMAAEGDTVLLSPGCASYDWYSSYAERGDDFTAAVAALGSRGEAR